MNIVLEPLQLKMENGREALEDDALLSVLEAMTFCLVFVFTLEDFLRDVVFERFLEILHAFDVQLNIWRRETGLESEVGYECSRV